MDKHLGSLDCGWGRIADGGKTKIGVVATTMGGPCTFEKHFSLFFHYCSSCYCSYFCCVWVWVWVCACNLTWCWFTNSIDCNLLHFYCCLHVIADIIFTLVHLVIGVGIMFIFPFCLGSSCCWTLILVFNLAQH